MGRYYSPSTGGFYLQAVHGDTIPDDVVEVADDDYRVLMEGQGQGKQIVPDADGNPVLRDPVPV